MASMKFSDRPLNVEAGAAGRVFKGAVAGAVAGAGVGAAAGATVLGVGALFGGWAGALIGGITGITIGFKSSDPEKIRNRPVTIKDPLGETKTVYISAEQWREIKDSMAKGFTYDEFPAPLDKQFQAANPPAPAEA